VSTCGHRAVRMWFKALRYLGIELQRGGGYYSAS
jgi:hypothetical protein